MAISLRKGGNISLKKAASDSGSTAPLTDIMVTLDWQERVTDGADFDVDASGFLLGTSGKVRGTHDFIFYNQLKSTCGSVEHQGDDTTGASGEKIKVNLPNVPGEIEKISFVVTIHDAEANGQNFGMISDAYINIVNAGDGKEIARYDLSEDASTETAMVFAELYKRNGEWKFKAVGQGYAGGLAALCKNYGVNI